MIPNHPHVCLYQPEIPQNTGNIGRLCAATQSRLHLIEPFGFKIDDKQVRRAGLDYWPYLDMKTYKSLDEFSESFDLGKCAFLSKFGQKSYEEIPIDVEAIIFGSETSGLPENVRNEYSEQCYRIPMFHKQVRSLNLANSVSIVTYDLLRRRNCFEGQ